METNVLKTKQPSPFPIEYERPSGKPPKRMCSPIGRLSLLGTKKQRPLRGYWIELEGGFIMPQSELDGHMAHIVAACNIHEGLVAALHRVTARFEFAIRHNDFNTQDDAALKQARAILEVASVNRKTRKPPRNSGHC